MIADARPALAAGDGIKLNTSAAYVYDDGGMHDGNVGLRVFGAADCKPVV
jgi:hypothetical protein